MESDYRAREARRLLAEAAAGPIVFWHYSCGSISLLPAPDRPAGPFAVRAVGGRREEATFAPSELGELGALDAFAACARDLDVRLARRGYPPTWVGWETSKENFGFRAIAARHSRLGGHPYLPLEQLDLSDKLKDMYGPRYADHDRLYYLARLNQLNVEGLIARSEDRKAAFDRGDWYAILRNTTGRVAAINGLFDLAVKGLLAVKEEAECGGFCPDLVGAGLPLTVEKSGGQARYVFRLAESRFVLLTLAKEDQQRRCKVISRESAEELLSDYKVEEADAYYRFFPESTGTRRVATPAKLPEMPPPNEEPQNAGRKKATFNARMRDTLDRNPASSGWSARQWSIHLSCSKSTVHSQPTWKELMKLKAVQRLARRMRE